jgi:hypothetical protein
MSDRIESTEVASRWRVVEFVTHALWALRFREMQAESEESILQRLIRRLALHGAGDFGVLSPDVVRRHVSTQSRLTEKTAIRVAAELSAECGAFGDKKVPDSSDPLSHVVNVYERAWVELTDVFLRRSMVVGIVRSQMAGYQRERHEGNLEGMRQRGVGLVMRLAFALLDFSTLDFRSVVAQLEVATSGVMDDEEGAIRVAAELSVQCRAFGDALDPGVADSIAAVKDAYRDAWRRPRPLRTCDLPAAAPPGEPTPAAAAVPSTQRPNR